MEYLVQNLGIETMSPCIGQGNCTCYNGGNFNACSCLSVLQCVPVQASLVIPRTLALTWLQDSRHLDK